MQKWTGGSKNRVLASKSDRKISKQRDYFESNRLRSVESNKYLNKVSGRRFLTDNSKTSHARNISTTISHHLDTGKESPLHSSMDSSDSPPICQKFEGPPEQESPESLSFYPSTPLKDTTYNWEDFNIRLTAQEKAISELSDRVSKLTQSVSSLSHPPAFPPMSFKK